MRLKSYWKTITLILVDNMSFKDKLYNIYEDLNSHKRDRDTLLSVLVEERLQKALNSYNQDIANGIGYISRRSELRVLKKLNQGMKTDD